MTDANAPIASAPPAAVADASAAVPPRGDAGHLPARWIAAGAVLLAVLSAAAAVYAWNAQQRLKGLEQQMVRRQDDSSATAAEAQMLAKQAQDSSRDAAAKLALLEARVAETTLQRTQLEELIQSLSRSRDENLLADVEAAIRVALQQTAITGSAEPLVIALKQTEERLARHNQPRLEGVRRAVAQDLDLVRAAGAVDLSTLAIRLDEVVRLVDELPLLSAPERRPGTRAAPQPNAAEGGASAAGRAAWLEFIDQRWAAAASGIWDEVRRLVRVTPIEQPEAMLIAPDQVFFLRENLKLRLLNARLALLSRQFDTAQADLREAQAAIERYFDRSAKRVVIASELLRQVSAQAKQVSVPRPDATLAAIAALAAGR